MKKRDLQREKLERIERAVLRSGKTPDAEIEKIVSAPQLFERVRTNIKMEELRRETRIKNRLPLPSLQFWNWQKAFLAFAAIAILIFSASALFVSFSTPPETAQQNTKQAAVSQVEKEPETIAPRATETPKPEPRFRQTGTVKKAKAKNNPQNLQKSGRKKRNLPQKFENQSDEPFMALTYAANLANEESQIVQVEMTPARLLALGIAVQTENEYEKIKTDLLVGSDGVARAIRVIK